MARLDSATKWNFDAIGASTAAAKFGHFALRLVLTVGLDLKPADKQGWQNVLSLVLGPNADASARWRNMGVIVRRNIIIAAIGSVHNKWLKWLRGQPIPNVLRHVGNLPKTRPTINTGGECPNQPPLAQKLNIIASAFNMRVPRSG